ncbi:uncharacterized protein LOC129744653 [Uranotaenia lowii]|uniref:uncharacterized protein LOC129744653 n=1 Tax=Uranotaenia lowii TaxID=190385 RepID=UPI0024789743|nr:uncharacterized protein LOC129744653 [Uranotaenia lowii]XP_055593258.1 uncharacterized protein LOC129744653 [Uranotaenia lowii]
MENLLYPPVEFLRPDEDEGTSSETIFEEFSIVLHNIKLLEKIPTKRWLEVLQEKATGRQRQNHREADRMQNLSVQLAENDELDKAMIQITQALYRCPPDGILIKAILCQKGELLRRRERIQDAIRHLEHCLRIEGERFSFGTYLCLLRCYKAMGNTRKVQTTLSRCAVFFNRWKDEFQRYDSQLKNQPDAHMEEMKKEFDLHANCIPLEITSDRSFRKEPAVQDNYEEDIDLEPFLGYSTDSKLHGASKACSIEVEDFTPKLMANTFIPEGSTVLVERPLETHLEFTKVQCYTCHTVNPHLIPCFDCQGVFYCSYECQQQDEPYHRFECTGYHLLFFPLVSGNLELRMLIRTLQALDRLLTTKYSPAKTAPLRTANELYRFLFEGRESNVELFNALLLKPDYSSFRSDDFNSLMVKTEKLLSYVKFDGRVKSDYFSKVEAVNELQFDLFVGGLLLHFCTLTMTKVNRLFFEIQANEEFVGRIQDFNGVEELHEDDSLKKTVLESLERYERLHSSTGRGSLDSSHLREGVLEYLECLGKDGDKSRKVEKGTELDDYHQVWTRTNVKRLWQECLDSVRFEDASGSRDSEKNDEELEHLEDLVSRALRRFCDAYFEYFGDTPMCSKRKTFPNVLRTFHPTATKLKHSCGPNLFFAMVSNGLFVVRAQKDICEGEELTINHGLHYKEAPREERRNYLRKIYIDCDCIECGRIEDHWIRYQRVKCNDCLLKAEAPQRTCPQCLQSKETAWPTDVLITQLQALELNLSRNNIPHLMPLSSLSRSAVGLQTATASGKRKIEVLLFFEKIWQLVFVDGCNLPMYGNLKEQLSCFADEVIRDAIDEVYILLKRCKDFIDTLYPYMSVQVAHEYELVVRRTVKYMLPTKFLGVDVRQVYRTIDLSRAMIRHSFAILEGHFLYDDDLYHKLMVVEYQLRMFEDTIRITSAKDESELFLMMIESSEKPKKTNAKPKPFWKSSSQDSNNTGSSSNSNSNNANNNNNSSSKSANDAHVILDLQHLSDNTKKAFLEEVTLGKGKNGASKHKVNGTDTGATANTNGNQENGKGPLYIVNGNESSGKNSDDRPGLGSPKKRSESKRKEAVNGTVPKPCRTTKHHRKV